MTESQKLLADYAETGSEAAFRELVGRYVGLVHSTALRLMDGDVQSAEDVTQIVFVHLARNARKLARESFLGGWLHRDTCYEAAKALRSERRRRAREEQAVAMNSLTDHSEANLKAVAPILDEAINLLGAEDRAVILLRFFEQRDFRSVGAALGSSEDAARMRVNRAIGKLHQLLQRRGATLSATALATALAANAVAAPPAGLATSIASTVLAGSVAGGGVSSALLKLMTITKLKTGIAATLVIASAATTLVVHSRARAGQRDQETALSQQAQQLSQIKAENARLGGLGGQQGDPIASGAGELTRLRAEAEALRKQAAEQSGLREENRRLKVRYSSNSIKARTALQLQEQNLAALTFSKKWMLAFHLYANDNNAVFPANFDKAEHYLGSEAKDKSGFTTDHFEIVYHGPQDGITNSATTIIFREKEPRQGPDGTWQKAYGFADGHSELHQTAATSRSEADADFAAFEKERIITPRSQ